MSASTSANMAVEADLPVWLALVRQIAVSVWHQYPAACIDDLIGAGNIGLVQAWRSYDSRRGAPFGAYARIRIHGHMLDHVKQESRFAALHRVQEKVEDDEQCSLPSCGSSEAVSSTRQDLRLTLRRLATLGHRSRAIMAGVMNGENIARIATANHLSTYRVRRLRDKAIATLRAA